MIRSTLTDLNPVKFNYYPFMVSVDKCNGSCNIALNKKYVFVVKQKMKMLKYLI